MKNESEFYDFLEQCLKESAKYETCMSLYVNTKGKCIELYLDTGTSTYSEWIRGEGGDIGLMRCQDTDRVMGVRLPLYQDKLSVGRDDESFPVKVDDGFLKGEGS